MQNRMLAGLLALLLAAAPAGCAPQQGREPQPEASGQAPREQAGEATGQQSPGQQNSIHNWQGELTVYHAYAEPAFHLELQYLPVPRQVNGPLDAALLRELTSQPWRDEGYYGEEMDFTMGVEGDTATFYLSRLPDGSYSQQCQLFTLWATLTQNDTGIDRVRFLLEPQDNQPVSMTLIQLDDDGYVMETEVTLPAYSMDELAALRAQAPPFAPNQDLYGGEIPLLHLDPAAGPLAHFIAQVTMWNLPAHSFAHIGEAPEEFITMAGVQLAPNLFLEQRFFPAEPDLQPLGEVIGNTEGRTQEHVQQAAQLLFGPGVQAGRVLPHPWRYIAYAGMYTLPFNADVPDLEIPVILGWEELEDRYEVEAVFIPFNHRTGQYQDWFGNELPGEALETFARETAPRHHITIGKTDSFLVYQAHRLPEIAYQLNPAARVRFRQYLSTDVLMSVRLLAAASMPYAWSHTFPVDDSHEFVVDEDAPVVFEVIPTFTGSTVRLEALDWERDSGQVKEVLYEAVAEEGYTLRIKAQDAQDGARLRLVVEYGGERAAYLLDQESGGGGITTRPGVLLELVGAQ